MGKEPSILYFLATEIHATGKEEPSTPVKGPAIIYNGLVNLKRDHPLWAIALPLGTLTYSGAFRIKRLSRKGSV